jgi:hypothetical protein
MLFSEDSIAGHQKATEQLKNSCALNAARQGTMYLLAAALLISIFYN